MGRRSRFVVAMRRFKTIYLAGPDAQFPEADALLERKRALVEAEGLEAATAEDGVRPAHGVRGALSGELRAREIYSAALASLRGADAVIANLTPWRGPGCDQATAFELGFAAALGKPVFAYMNVEDEDDAEYRDRVDAWLGASPDTAGVWRDAEGCVVEDLALPEAAMIWAEARRVFIVVTPEPFEDTAGLELCLEALKEYAD